MVANPPPGGAAQEIETGRGGVGAGMILAIVGFLLLPVGDAIGKYLVEQDVRVLQITWGRWFFHSLLLTPIVLVRFRSHAFRVSNPFVQLLRASMLAMATVFFFSAVGHIPLADATAVLFVAPLIVVALSTVFLKERVGIRRWAAVAIGFAGVLLIVRPGAETLRFGAVLALGAAFCFAFYLLFTRRAAGHAPPIVALWWMGLTGMVLTSFFAIPGWEQPTVEQWILMASIGLVMVAGHLMVFWAADRVEASALAVTPYLEMVTSTVLGFWIFGDFPDLYTWIGCGVVVSAGLFVAWREQQAARRGNN